MTKYTGIVYSCKKSEIEEEFYIFDDYYSAMRKMISVEMNYFFFNNFEINEYKLLIEYCKLLCELENLTDKNDASLELIAYKWYKIQQDNKLFMLCFVEEVEVDQPPMGKIDLIELFTLHKNCSQDKEESDLYDKILDSMN